MNRVGDYVGQKRGEVSVGGELIELRPSHHTSWTIALESLCREIVRDMGRGMMLGRTKRLRASCFRTPNPVRLATLSSSSVSIEIISPTEYGVATPDLAPPRFRTMMESVMRFPSEITGCSHATARCVKYSAAISNIGCMTMSFLSTPANSLADA